MGILESFELTQAVQDPAHSKGHILDLVLSSGLSPDNLTIKDICLLDHKAVLFNIILSQTPFNHSTPVIMSLPPTKTVELCKPG